MTSPNGYAAAVQPVSPAAIHTSDAELIVGDVEIPVPGTTLPAYRAMPADGCRFPIVLVIEEIFGLHEYIKDVCRRFARRGYLAVAPQIFARAGDPSGLTDFEEIRAIVNATPDEQTMEDLDATVAWVAGDGFGDPSRVGIIGFCWGGRAVWLYAAHSSTLKAGVAWYGRLAGDPTANQPRWPVDIATSLKCPVLGLYGGDDPAIPLDIVEQMRSSLRSVGSPSEIIVYPDAKHGFHADYRPSYSPDDAVDGERRMFEWLAEHGVA